MLVRLTLALICATSFWSDSATAEPRLMFSGKASLQTGGGLSGLELNADGKSGIAVSDRGDLFAVRLNRTDGALSKAILTPWPNPSKIAGDVEGSATADHKTYFFSLEGPAKVISLSSNGEINTLPKHPNFAKMESNRALEALAIDQHGTLYTLAEKGSQLYAFKDEKWEHVADIPQLGPFLAVGADFGPNNLFYLLERTITPFGFRTRVRRFDLNAKRLSEETLLTTSPSHHDNLEGISLWVDKDGKTRVTIISDDNFLPILRNEIVEYILEE